MCNLRRIAVVLLLAALVTEAYSLDAAATVVNLDEFAVVRNGTTIFDDPKSGSWLGCPLCDAGWNNRRLRFRRG